MKELTSKEMMAVNGGGFIKDSFTGYVAEKTFEAAVKLGKALKNDATRVSGERFADKDYREKKRNSREGRGGRSHERSHGGREERHAGDSGRDNR